MSSEQESNAGSTDALRADEEQSNIPKDDIISQNDMNNTIKDDGTIEELVDESFSGYDEEIVVEDGDGAVVEEYCDAMEEEVILEDGEDISEEEIIDEEHGTSPNNKYDDNRSLDNEEMFEEILEYDSVNTFEGSGYYEEEIVDEDEEDNSPRMPTLVEEDNIDSTSVPDLNVDMDDINETDVPISEQEVVTERTVPRRSSSFKVVTPLRTTIIVGAPLSPEKIPNRTLEGAPNVPVPFIDDSHNEPIIQTQTDVEDTKAIENDNLPIPVEEIQKDNQATMHQGSVEDTQELENNELPILAQELQRDDSQEIENKRQDENNQEIDDIAIAEAAREANDTQQIHDQKLASETIPKQEEPSVDSKVSPRKPFSTWFNRGTPVTDAAPQKTQEPNILPLSPKTPKPFDESMADEDVVASSSAIPVAFTNLHVDSPDDNKNDPLSQESELALEIKRLEEEINSIHNQSLPPRPYDEFTEKDDPTDEWQGRSEEAAKLAKASYRKPTNQFVASGEIPKESMASSRDEEATAVNNTTIDLDKSMNDDDEAAEWTEMGDKSKSSYPDGFDPNTLSLPAQRNDYANEKPQFLAAPFAKEFVDNSEHNPDTVRSADKGEEVAPYQVSSKKSSKEDGKLLSTKSETNETRASAAEQSFLGSRKFTILVCILTVIVIALAIVLGVLLGGNNDDNDRDIVIPETPTSSPGSTASVRYP